MIKNIFLPEKIGNYYLFAKRIVGLDIGKTIIRATQLQATGNSVVVEKCLQEHIEVNGTERVAQAIASILSKCDKFDEIRVGLPSNVAVFKELRLPFTSHEKIKMVINFEVEQLLPFPVQDAVIDFIITKVNEQDGSAEVLVAAVQKKHVLSYMQLFEKTGIAPDIVTIDLFQLYGLYKQIPHYANMPGSVVVIDLGFQTTRIAHIDSGQLRSIRFLSQGIWDAAKSVAETHNQTPSEIMDYFMRFGFEKTGDQKYNKAMIDALSKYWQTINFTLNSFVFQSSQEQPIGKIILLGAGANILGISSFVTQQSGVESEIFDVQSIIQNNLITIKNGTRIDYDAIMSFSIAYPSALVENFNLLKDDLAPSDTTLLMKQLITALALGVIIICSLGAYTFFEVHKFSTELHESKKEALDELKSKFKKIEDDDVTDLEDAIEIAKGEVKLQKAIYDAFQERTSFLKYLFELFTKIDSESLGLVVESIAFRDNTITLKAKVRDYTELKMLEHELSKSKLFKQPIPPQADFKAINMKIELAPTSGGK